MFQVCSLKGSVTPLVYDLYRGTLHFISVVCLTLPQGRLGSSLALQSSLRSDLLLFQLFLSHKPNTKSFQNKNLIRPVMTVIINGSLQGQHLLWTLEPQACPTAGEGGKNCSIFIWIFCVSEALG